MAPAVKILSESILYVPSKFELVNHRKCAGLDSLSLVGRFFNTQISSRETSFFSP
jgi:hypothetical protein